MKKFKVLFSPPDIKEEEIEQHMDFDSLLKAHKVATAKLLYKKIVSSIIGGAGIVGISIFAGLQLMDTPEADIMAEVTEDVVNINVQVPAENNLMEQVEFVKEESFTEATVSEEAEFSAEAEQEEESIKQEDRPKAVTPVNTEPVKAVQTQTQVSKSREIQVSGPVPFSEAEPVDGYENLYRYIKENLKYPEKAFEEGLQGSVIVGFFINDKGKPEDIEIVKSLSPETDNEAIRLIKDMPLWKPARAGKRIVKTQVAVPVKFELH